MAKLPLLRHDSYGPFSNACESALELILAPSVVALQTNKQTDIFLTDNGCFVEGLQVPIMRRLH